MTRFEITYSASGIPLTKSVVEAINIPAAENIHHHFVQQQPTFRHTQNEEMGWSDQQYRETWMSFSYVKFDKILVNYRRDVNLIFGGLGDLNVSGVIFI